MHAVLAGMGGQGRHDRGAEALAAGGGKRADPADLGDAPRRVVVARSERRAVRGEGGGEDLVAGEERGADRLHRAVRHELLGHSRQFGPACRTDRRTHVREGQPGEREHGGQAQVVRVQDPDGDALGQGLRGERVVRVENHQRTFRHREPGRLDESAQGRCHLGEPLERLRHTELALPGAHAGDIGGGDARAHRTGRSGTGGGTTGSGTGGDGGRTGGDGVRVVRAAVVRGALPLPYEEPQGPELLRIREPQRHGGVVQLDAVTQSRFAHAAHPITRDPWHRTRLRGTAARRCRRGRHAPAVGPSGTPSPATSPPGHRGSVPRPGHGPATTRPQ